MTETLEISLSRAVKLTESGRSDQAIEVLRPLTARYPDQFEPWGRLAEAYLNEGQPDRALDAAQRAALLVTNQEWPYRLASIAHSDLGHHPEAIATAQKAIDVAPSNWVCYIALAEALIASGAMRDIATGQRAIDAARQAKDLAPHEPRPWEVLGDLGVLSGRWDIAEQSYNTALKLDPENRHAKINLSLVHRRVDDSPRMPIVVETVRPEPDEMPAEYATLLGQLPTVVWPLLTQLSLIQLAGAFALAINSMANVTSGDALLGLVLIGVLTILLGRFVLRIPKPARPLLPQLLRSQPPIAATAAVFAFGTAILALWTLLGLIQLGSVIMLTLTMISSAVAALLALFGKVRQKKGAAN